MRLFRLYFLVASSLIVVVVSSLFGRPPPIRALVFILWQFPAILAVVPFSTMFANFLAFVAFAVIPPALFVARGSTAILLFYAFSFAVLATALPVPRQLGFIVFP
jgi:hypothetical protein